MTKNRTTVKEIKVEITKKEDKIVDLRKKNGSQRQCIYNKPKTRLNQPYRKRKRKRKRSHERNSGWNPYLGDQDIEYNCCQHDPQTNDHPVLYADSLIRSEETITGGVHLQKEEHSVEETPLKGRSQSLWEVVTQSSRSKMGKGVF